MLTTRTHGLGRVAAGEDWPELMRETGVTGPYCTYEGPKGTSDCGTPWAQLYFVSYVALLQYGFLPLFVASFLSTFFETVGQQTAITSEELALLTRVWATLDLKRSGFIAAWKLRLLLDKLLVAGSTLAVDAVTDAARYEQLVAMLAHKGTPARELRFVDVAMGLTALRSFESYIPRYMCVCVCLCELGCWRFCFIFLFGNIVFARTFVYALCESAG
jgi:hypothetical protein